MMENKKNPKENAFKGIMDEDDFKRTLEVPAQAMDIVLDTTRKVQEASLEYFRQVEKIQRDYWQGMTKLMGVALPGESNLWDAQVKLIENGFDMFDRMMAVGKKA
ncbi:MAG TPA: hypothetical protein V6D23_23290 [Candidatus Obscuribacterales bacterium]